MPASQSPTRSGVQRWDRSIWAPLGLRPRMPCPGPPTQGWNRRRRATTRRPPKRCGSAPTCRTRCRWSPRSCARERANMPHALPMEAALLRAAFDDAGAAAVLARIGWPRAGDLVARYERVREGTTDPPLWDLLAANPERLLEMADTYIQWGLLRDVLVLVTHKYAQPVPALNNALMFYYRSYCRDLLDYSYYAGEDLRVIQAIAAVT